jgi:hypothetical protein
MRIPGLSRVADSDGVNVEKVAVPKSGRVLHGLPASQNLKPAPAPPNTHTLEAGRGFPTLTGRGFLTGIGGYGGFLHAEGCGFVHINGDINLINIDVIVYYESTTHSYNKHIHSPALPIPVSTSEPLCWGSSEARGEGI